MELSKIKAIQLFEEIYGRDVEWVRDPFGTWIYKKDFNDGESSRHRPGAEDFPRYRYGWGVILIRPEGKCENLNAAHRMDNMEIVHLDNIRQINGNYPTFRVNGKEYKVVKLEWEGLKADIYGIVDMETKAYVDHKGANKTYSNR